MGVGVGGGGRYDVLCHLEAVASVEVSEQKNASLWRGKILAHFFRH